MIMGTLGGPNVWEVSAEERARHDAQFFSLKPVNGFITGDQARGFFLKSGLPSQVLAQVWNLADINKDGRMDRKEFSIAMHLIQKKLQGFGLPSVLPESMKVDPQPAVGTFGAVPMAPMGSGPPPVSYPAYGQPLSAGMPPIGMSPVTGGGFMNRPGSVPTVTLTDSAQEAFSLGGGLQRKTSLTAAPNAEIDWSMPQPVRLKHSQTFNMLDKSRQGFLSGAHARNILGQSGLPNPMLAQIWTLSDMDKDGRLNCEEFCVAMHLIEMLKSGKASQLPPRTPAELVQSAHSGTGNAARTRTVSQNSLGGMSIDSGGGEEGMTEAQIQRSFENKRKENFDRGQAELGRRRQALMEIEKREREQRERKEREEMERRERERMEAEKRRQLEAEKQMAKQREAEQKREAEYKKMMEQREAARRELERQRQIEMERMKLQELTVERQREQESVCHLKQQHKNLSFQLQALTEKSTEMNAQVTEIRNSMLGITQSIEGMRGVRDGKVSDIESLRRQCQEASAQLSNLQNERAGLQAQRSSASAGGSSVSESYRQVMQSFHNRELNMTSLREQLTQLESERRDKQSRASDRQGYLETLRNQLNELRGEEEALVRRIETKQTEVSAKFGTPLTPGKKDAWGANNGDSAAATTNGEWAASDAWGAASGDVSSHATAVENNAGARTVRYRALYEFKATHEDELSFMPGDLILVFRDHAAEPGWLAGQFQDKVGWFPEAYAEQLDAGGGGGFGDDKDFGTVSPSSGGPTARIAGGEVNVLDGIHEESSSSLEREDASVTSAAAPNTATGATETTGTLQAQALYPWKARKEDQMTFAKGDLITILEQDEMWWRGRLDFEGAGSQEGWFPKSYVKLISGPRKRSSSRAATPETESAPEPMPAPAVVAGSPEGEIWQAVYPFVATEAGDLGFQVGDHIKIISQEGEWWTGRLNGREGIFPANYVSPLESQAVPAVVEPAAVDPAAVPAAPKSPAPSVTSVGSSGAGDVELAQVIAPFTAVSPIQLTLKVGDVVRIRNRSPTGWTEGELQRSANGDPPDKRVGWFPASYVKPLGSTSRKSMDSAVTGSGVRTASIDSTRSKETAGGAGTAGLGGRSGSMDSTKSRDASAVSRPSVLPISEQSAGDEYVQALWDYSAQQSDELGFSQGARIRVLERMDDAWWRGEFDGAVGVFPSNYVQPITSGTPTSNTSRDQPPANQRTPSSQPASNAQSPLDAESPVDLRVSERRKRDMYVEELIQTEQNYQEDLAIVKTVFFDSLIGSEVLTPDEQKTLLINWDELQNVSRAFLRALRKNSANVGAVVCEHITPFRAFLIFCKYQQQALDLVEVKERTSGTFRAAYAQCRTHPAARHMPLNYHLLLPMTRVTKYPLVVEKILKYTPTDVEDRENLSQALASLKSLCSEVNQVVTEMENLQMLYWCQHHIKCESLRPMLIFHSQTRSLGPRKFVHAGALFKAKSNRLLIGLLFNDLLMLTTPDEQIDHPDSFKLTRLSDIELSMYKQPILLKHAKVVTSANGSATGSGSSSDGEDTAFTIICSSPTSGTSTPSSTDTLSIALKAVSSNAKLLWLKQLNKTIEVAKSEVNLSPVAASPAPRKGVGRLLVEVICVRQLTSPPGCQGCTLFCNLTCGPGQVQRKSLAGMLDSASSSASGDSLVTTQFVIESKTSSLKIDFTVGLLYAPDLSLGWVEVPVSEMLRESGFQRGPVIKQYPLANEFQPGSNACVLVKYVVQLFEEMS